MQMEKWDACAFSVDEQELTGGLELSSSIDIIAFVLVFPPRDDTEKYVILPYFWIPEENMIQRVRRVHVPYDVWAKQEKLMTTEGNVIHYGFIENFIDELGNRFHIKEYLTAGERCRWYRTWKDWDSQCFRLGKDSRICHRRVKN